MRMAQRTLALGLLSTGLACAAVEESGETEPATAATTAADGDDAGSTAAATGGDSGEDAGQDSGTDDGTGAPLPEFMCEDRGECQLHSDCCSCVALHEDQPAPACDDNSCMRGQCEIWGIERLLCSHTCLIELVECDAAMVMCSDPPPDCEAGFTPSIDERCWSGRCVPDDLCRPL